ncbi:hypothetical protein GVAV_002724 [Gurleya vavrai]
MLEWTNIEIDVPNKNKSRDSKYVKLVDNLSGCCKRGELLAIMGPSGCGKTTFLSGLAGRIQSGSITRGNIQYDGKQRDARKWLSIIGFVDQDDQIFEKLTVVQTLTFAANFRLKNSSNSQIQSKISELIEKFKLKHVRLNQMHKLSGGERKRVMLAIELITDPEIIFMDEPTSGLDTMTALTIIRMLKELANNNKIVIITIHQPSIEIFSLFDKLLLMTEAKTVYYGDPGTFESHLKEKGVVKREGTSFPDFIAEMVVRENIYEQNNSYHQVIFQMIQDNLKNEKKYQHTIKKNESYRVFNLKFKHFYNIYKRLWILELKSKRKFIKALLSKIFSVLIFSILMAVIAGSRTEVEFHLENDSEHQKEMKKKLVPVLLHFSQFFEFPYSANFLFAIIMTTNVTAFFFDKAVIKREIAVGSYSTFTYFISILIFRLTNEISSIITILITHAFFYRSQFSILAILYKILIVFTGCIIGTCFGATVDNKIVLNVISSLLFLVLSLPFAFYKIFKIGITTLVESSIVYYIIRILTDGLLIIFAPYHIVNFFIHFAYQRITNFESKDILCQTFFMRQILNTKHSTLNYAFDLNLKVWHLSILFATGMIILIAFANYRRSSILMPIVRMTLGK